MRPDLLASLRRLSDSELADRVQELAARERGATVLLVAHLAELDTRDLHFRAGHGSLFAYCRDVLGLAEQEAYNRIAVARAVRRFPVILELLEGGALNLTSVRLLGPHLTPANHAQVLESARGRTKAQVEELAAALWPRPDAPSFVRKLPATKSVPAATAQAASSFCPPAGSASAVSAATCRSSDAAGPSGPPAGPSSPPPPASAASATPLALSAVSGAATSPAGPYRVADPAAPAPGTPAGQPPGFEDAPPHARRSAEVTALSPDRYRVHVTIGGETLEKLRLAKDLLRHAVPSGDEAVILDRALTALLADLARKKLGAADKPRPGAETAPGSRRIPAEVRRKVWLRDRGRCAFVATSGRRCSERAFLEFHHVRPFALGGEATLSNIELRCRSHNAYEARLYFGHGNGGAGSVAETPLRYAATVESRTGAVTVGPGS